MKIKIFLTVLLLMGLSVRNASADDLTCECGVTEWVYGDDGSVVRRNNYGHGWEDDMTCSRNADSSVTCVDTWNNDWTCSSNTDGTASCSSERWNNSWSCDNMTDCMGFPYNTEEALDLVDVLGFTPSETWQYGYKSQESSTNNENMGDSGSSGSQISGSTETAKIAKRIYTVEEATRLSKDTGNTIKLRFK